MSSMRRSIRWQAPTRLDALLVLVISAVVLALTGLRVTAGMDPDEAAARGVAAGLAIFVCLAVVARLPIVNVSASLWCQRRVLEPWLNSIEDRQNAIISELDGLDGDPDEGARQRKPPRRFFSWWTYDRFEIVVECLAMGAVATFAFLCYRAVHFSLLAAGGVEEEALALGNVLLLAISGVLALAIYQIPLLYIMWRMCRLERMLRNIERQHDRGVAAASRQHEVAIAMTRWASLIEPAIKYFGPIPWPVWRHPQPDPR